MKRDVHGAGLVGRSSRSVSYVDVLDRVLDKGIVIDAQMQISVFGIALMTVEGHMIVASIDTYFRYWPDFGGTAEIVGRSFIVDGI